MSIILFLTKYSRTGASSRYRSFQYLPFLDQTDIEYVVSPLFDDSYLANRYRHGSGSKVDVVHAFLRRIGVLLKARKFDLLVIEYELLPYFPAFFELLLNWLGVRYVVDYDDALFHQYDRHRSPLVRSLLNNKIIAVMRHAELVIAGNEYLADYAIRAGATKVEIIPTVIDLERYILPETRSNDNDEFIIGWIGSPSTAKYLQSIAPVLAEVCREGKAKLRLVGSGPVGLPGIDIEVIPWSDESEVDLIHSFDIGIMPLPDEPWTRGKCGFKLIQYMACALPVIASPVGVNSEIVEHGVNGFLASTQKEWQEAFTALMAAADLRQKMGEAGRKKTAEQYCLQVTAPKLVSLLQNLVFKD